ncbi:MAG: N-formylglutamate amidohydrolase [Alphaproteobacteria bacterium]
MPNVQTAPLVISSPHSGRLYPACFLAASRLSLADLRRSEDAYVDIMVAAAPSLGLPLLAARLARAFIDLNREPFELDPAMFADVLPGSVNVRSARVAAGLGTIARCAGDGMEIYKRKLGLAEIMDRITSYYYPYHRALGRLIHRTRDSFGQCVVLDCHSMPSQRRAAAAGGRTRPGTGALRGGRSRQAGLWPPTGSGADIVLGTRYGRSCDPALAALVGDYFENRGYRVAHNQPYAGGHITARHGQPATGVHALQIEINRALYMDEATLRPRPALATLTADMTGLMHAVAALAPRLASGRFATPLLAAE